ncbi:MAG: hypothetical protein Kow00108_14110 [Calditrichia bacterium]
MFRLKKQVYIIIIAAISFLLTGCYTSFSQLSTGSGGNYLSSDDGYVITTSTDDYIPVASDEYYVDDQMDVSIHLTIGNGYGSWYYPDQLILFYDPDPWRYTGVIYVDPYPSYGHYYPHYPPWRLVVMDPWWWDWYHCGYIGMVYYPVYHPVYYWDDWYRYETRYPSKKRDWAKRDSRTPVRRKNSGRELAPAKNSGHIERERLAPTRTVTRVSEEKRIIHERKRTPVKEARIKERTVREDRTRIQSGQIIRTNTRTKQIQQERKTRKTTYTPNTKRRVSENSTIKPTVYPGQDPKPEKTRTYNVRKTQTTKKVTKTRSTNYYEPQKNSRSKSTKWTTKTIKKKSSSYKPSRSGFSKSATSPKTRSSSGDKSRRRNR